MKPETFELVLFEIFSNPHDFGFAEVYCFNYHGDPLHIGSIFNAIKKANSTFDMKIKFMMEEMDLQVYNLNGTEDFLSVFAPQYKMEWFECSDISEQGLLDIHAGAYETGMLQYMYPELVNTDLAKTLDSYSLTYEILDKWMDGRNSTVEPSICRLPSRVPRLIFARIWAFFYPVRIRTYFFHSCLSSQHSPRFFPDVDRCIFVPVISPPTEMGEFLLISC